MHSPYRANFYILTKSHHMKLVNLACSTYTFSPSLDLYVYWYVMMFYCSMNLPADSDCTALKRFFLSILTVCNRDFLCKNKDGAVKIFREEFWRGSNYCF